MDLQKGHGGFGWRSSASAAERSPPPSESCHPPLTCPCTWPPARSTSVAFAGSPTRRGCLSEFSGPTTVLVGTAWAPRERGSTLKCTLGSGISRHYRGRTRKPSRAISVLHGRLGSRRVFGGLRRLLSKTGGCRFDS